jgi:hypothetical protein
MALLPLKSIEAINFSDLRRPQSPNTFLMTPPGWHGTAGDCAAPVFDRPWQETAIAWDAMIARQSRVSEHNRSGDGRQRTYVQRTALVGFPDVITVEFVDLDGGQSSLIVYSRSQYGYSDIGANRRRVLAWIADVGA